MVKVKPLKSSWDRKMKAKASLENVSKLQHEIREKIAAKKAVSGFVICGQISVFLF